MLKDVVLIKGREYVSAYKVVDDDFTYIFVTCNEGLIIPACIYVIREYEERDLPVAANLIRLAKLLNTRDFNVSLIWWDANVPEYQKYKADVEKYLILME